MLTSDTLRDFDDLLTSPLGNRFVDVMRDLALGRQFEGQGDVLTVVREKGWLDAAGRLTWNGRLIGDALREYAFWLDRNRQLLSTEHHEALHRRCVLSGKHVLEVGCGFGVHLMSGAVSARSIVGVDPVPAYLQLGRPIAKLAGVPRPRVVCSVAEALPFQDKAFDMVLCTAALQYLDPRRSLREMTRVLAPGGELYLVTGNVWQNTRFFLESKRWLRSPRSAVGQIRSILNTFSDELCGRKLLVRKHASATASAAHPTNGFVRRCMTRSGLEPVEITAVGPYDTLYFARKPVLDQRSGSRPAAPPFAA